MKSPETREAKEKGKAFYTVTELMERWQVCRSTIYNEVSRGRLIRKHIAGVARFSAEEVMRYERQA